MEKKTLTCIGCPLGCRLEAVMDGADVISVEGYSCKRGLDYAHKELTHPTRIVTSTVALKGGDGNARTVSYKTKSDIPKDKVFTCMEALTGLCVIAPVHIGDVLLKNVADTGVDIVATSNAE